MDESSSTSCVASSSAVRLPPPVSSDSNTGLNTNDSHFVIAKCTRNTEVTTNPLNDQHEASEESDIEERVLAVYCRAGRLGAAYYTLQTGELPCVYLDIYLMSAEVIVEIPKDCDIVARAAKDCPRTPSEGVILLFILEELAERAPEFHMFRSLFRQVEPLAVLLDGSTQGAFVQAARSTVLAGDERCKLLLLASKEYSYEACKRRVLALSLPHEPRACSEEERALFLRTVVDFRQVQSVHALGALLRHLDLNWSSFSLNMQAKPQFLSLRIISLADIVTIDEDTYRALQVFSSAPHPSGFREGARGSAREGLSLCRLLGRTASRVGHARMRVFLRHPSRDAALLRRRQDVVAFFLQPHNDTLMRHICASLRYIKNVNGILAKIKALSAKAYQWKSLYNTLYNAVLICEMCENVKSCEFLEELASFDNNKLYEMALYMNRIIDFDLSKSEGKFTVKAGVDPELDIKKQTMASLHTLMSESAAAELARLPPFVQECSMLYMPHLGYLLAVRAWAPDLTHHQKELPDMKFMFQNNDHIHYKSKGCEELDVMIGDTYPEIVAHETRIMMRLTAIILENLHTLATVIDKCAELDCLIAISKVCKEYNYVRPVLTESKVISIKEGRHPLHILSCDNFVPNDVESSDSEGCLKILTGPNSSGKSVYMKMIGLIVYLAHIGSFVPAASATIGVVRRLHSRMQAAECVARHMSAFLIDLRQMAVCIRESTPDSLILVDEFGKGTARWDGLALLAACLNSLLFRGPGCPHALVSTHYLNIGEYVVDSPQLKFLSFEYVLCGGAPVFLFRSTAGAAARSLAHAVAAAHGVPAPVLARAIRLMACYTNNSLPPPNKAIAAKQMACVQKANSALLRDDV